MKNCRATKTAAVFLSVAMLATLLVMVVPAGAGACGYSKWYLPEGYTGGNFDTYILIQNPNDCKAKVGVTFMTDEGHADPRMYEIEPLSRFTIAVDEIVGLENANVSTMVEQFEGSGIVVERAMYFNDASGKAGGSNSIGANQTSNMWYLAEGYTGGKFDTFILVMNPNEEKAHIKAKFITPPKEGAGGQMEPNYIIKEYDVEPMRRFTIHVDEIPGLENTEVSTEIMSEASGAGGECAQPVVAERAMYFDYFGINGGHCSIGAPAASNLWYLPEGRTAGEYDTYVLVMNPNSTRTHVKASFMVPSNGAGGGREMKPFVPDPETDPETPIEPNKVITKEFVLEPLERFTIEVDKIEGLEASDVGTQIESWAETGTGKASNETNPVVAERAMYFTRGNNGDGHNTIGATTKREYWLMAEGYTAGGFDTWLLIMNPNELAVRVQVTYMKPEGEPIVKEYEILGKSRLTIPVDEIEGLEATEVSSKIQVLGTISGRTAACEYGIIAERAMYFEYNGIVGGHCSLGVGEY
ncbi:MAG: hypothetical protein ACYC99_07385 [Candidatus Geothermincolia bacterium]